MKVFFGLLLIANIAFALFQWLMPYEQLFGETKKIPASEALQLLTDADIAIITEAEARAKVEAKAAAKAAAKARAIALAEAEAEAQAQAVTSDDADADAPPEKTPLSEPEQRVIEPEQLVVEDTSDRRVCYTIGPIKDKTRAVRISGRYSRKNAKIALKSSLEKDYQGVMVFIDGHKNRADAVRTANALTAKGIRDHIIVNNPARPYTLSLGVFGLKRNAAKLKKRIEKLNFDVKIQSRYRERTIYWLYGEQSGDDELLQLLSDADSNRGISQISSECGLIG